MNGFEHMNQIENLMSIIDKSFENPDVAIKLVKEIENIVRESIKDIADDHNKIAVQDETYKMEY